MFVNGRRLGTWAVADMCACVFVCLCVCVCVCVCPCTQMGVFAGHLAPFLHWRDLVHVSMACKYLRETATQDAAWRSSVEGVKGFTMATGTARSVKAAFVAWILARRKKKVCLCRRVAGAPIEAHCVVPTRSTMLWRAKWRLSGANAASTA